MTHLSRTLCSLLPLATLLWVLRPAAAQEAELLFEAHAYRSLVAEDKATRVGDVLTVIVQEAASASSSAELRRQRKFAVAAQAATSGVGPYSASASTASSSQGEGRTERSGRLLAQISVQVQELRRNGDLVVEGRQSLRINGEQQLITLRGVVRRRDIGADNTVPSSRIADAQIRFDGRGFVTEQTRPGWVARLLSLFGL